MISQTSPRISFGAVMFFTVANVALCGTIIAYALTR